MVMLGSLSFTKCVHILSYQYIVQKCLCEILRGIDFASISAIFQLNYWPVPTDWYFWFLIVLLQANYILAKGQGTNRQTVVDKIPHRKVKIKQREPHKRM